MKNCFTMRSLPTVMLFALLVTVTVCATAADKEKKGKKGKKGKAKTAELKVDDITLTVPVGWKKQKPANELRKAQFQIPAVKDDKEPAELVVSFFGGGGGGTGANVKRWVGQFQSKGREAKMTSGKSPQGEYVFVDLSGTYNKPVGPPFLRKTKPMPNSRMLAVILTVKGKGNYFLKLTGPKKTVAKAAAAFRKSFGADAKAEKKYELERRAISPA